MEWTNLTSDNWFEIVEQSKIGDKIPCFNCGKNFRKVKQTNPYQFSCFSCTPINYQLSKNEYIYHQSQSYNLQTFLT